MPRLSIAAWTRHLTGLYYGFSSLVSLHSVAAWVLLHCAIAQCYLCILYMYIHVALVRGIVFTRVYMDMANLVYAATYRLSIRAPRVEQQLTSLVYAYIRAPRVERSTDMCASARARAAQASSGARVRALQCSSASARVFECSSAVYRVSHFQTREYNRSHSTLEYKFHVTCTVCD